MGNDTDINEIAKRVGVALIDNTMVDTVIRNSIPLMKEWWDLYDNYCDDLQDVADNTIEMSNEIVDRAYLSFNMFQNSLTSDMFSNTNMNEMFDTPSVSAFVADAITDINLYRQASISGVLLAKSILNALRKTAEYINDIYTAIDEKKHPTYKNFREVTDEETNNIIDVFLSDEMKEFAKEFDGYGQPYTDYKNIHVVDITGTTEDDVDGDDYDEDSDSLDSTSDGVRSTLKAIEFDAGTLLNDN